MKWKSGQDSLNPPLSLSAGRQSPVSINGKTCLVEWLPSDSCLQIIDDKGVEQRIRIRVQSGNRPAGTSDIEITSELIAGPGRVLNTHFTLSPDVPGQEARAAKAASGGATVKSQLTGKVLQVLVQDGEAVKAGQSLVVIEAMKMENKVLAPTAGRVSGLTAQQATAICTGTVICKIVPIDA